MDFEKAFTFVTNSFLSSLLIDENITDISFNGEDIFYSHNIYGRQKSNIVINESDARDFVRQMANLSEKQFSYQTPILDISFAQYRINAVHQSIGRFNNKPCVTFSLRVASNKPIINDNCSFLTSELVSLIEVLVRSKVSILIGGLTGSGKTEFQKYLIRKIPKNTRLIIIDNVLELDSVRNDVSLDINIWQVDERNDSSTIQSLVKNGLRSNPDWLVVAESRGEEMIDILNSAMTGHPIITTLHSLDSFSMPSRIARMVMMNNKKSSYEEIMKDVLYHFRFYIYLNKNYTDNGTINRYISSVLCFDDNGKQWEIYRCENGFHYYEKIPNSCLHLLKYDNSDDLFIKTFLGVQNE